MLLYDVIVFNDQCRACSTCTSPALCWRPGKSRTGPCGDHSTLAKVCTLTDPSDSKTEDEGEVLLVHDCACFPPLHSSLNKAMTS